MWWSMCVVWARFKWGSSFPMYQMVLIRTVSESLSVFVLEYSPLTSLQLFLYGQVKKNLVRQIFRTSEGGTLALDWLLSSDVAEGATFVENKILRHDTTPIVVVIPGLTSDSDSAYLKHLAYNTAKCGRNVVVCNHRGLGGVSITERISKLYCGASMIIFQHWRQKLDQLNLLTRVAT